MSDEKKRRSGFFSRFKKEAKHAPLSGAALVAGTSGTSGTVSGSENSAATSKNLQNASKQLDQYLREMDDNDESLGDVISMSRFLEKVEAYENSSFAGCALRTVNIDASTLLMIDLAAKSAKKVYDKSESDDLEPFAFLQDGENKKIDADVFGGSVKATEVSLYKSKSSFTGPEGSGIKMIVVAIRGTASIHDWMVNFNDTGQPGSTQETIPSEFLGQTDTQAPYKIHNGFLTCAQRMAPKTATLISEILQSLPPDSKPPILVFTGHSAGGAVAALLYANMLKSPSSPLSPLVSHFPTIHCITFGAPPITSPALVPFQERSTFISFINEADPIPRCDNAYVNSLLRLFATPMPEQGAKWPLPEPLLFNAGLAVLIPKESDEGGATIFALPNDEGVGSLRETVMGNPKAHKMDLYLRKVRIAQVVLE